MEKVWERRSHAFPPHYTPVYSICAADTKRSFDWDLQNLQLTLCICCMKLKGFREAVIEDTTKQFDYKSLHIYRKRD